MLRYAGLIQRDLQPELMDQLTLEASRHFQALKGLERINLWSRSVRILWPSVHAYAIRKGLSTLRILDLATGAGDVPIGLWRKGRRSGLTLRIEGWDVNPRTVGYAEAVARREGVPVAFLARDALRDPIPTRFDVILCSLFLHHLDEEQAIHLLQGMGSAAQGMIMVNDLVRSSAGLALAQLGTRLLSASDVVHADGPRSVRAAWTVAELRDLALRAGLRQVKITRHWPFRFLLEWSRP